MTNEAQLTPSWMLTTNHPASSHGIPVLVRSSGNDVWGSFYGPGDILEAYRGWGFQPAAKVVERMAKMAWLSKEERELVDRFCQGGTS